MILPVKILLLIHILSAIVGLGMMVPDILLTKIYRESKTGGEKIRLARLHTRMVLAAQIAVILLFLTGSALTSMAGYKWFDFGSSLWLGIKQVMIFVMLAFTIPAIPQLLKAHRALGEKGEEFLPMYEQRRSTSHRGYGFALAMVIFAVLKPS